MRKISGAYLSPGCPVCTVRALPHNIRWDRNTTSRKTLKHLEGGNFHQPICSYASPGRTPRKGSSRTTSVVRSPVLRKVQGRHNAYNSTINDLQQEDLRRSGSLHPIVQHNLQRNYWFDVALRQPVPANPALLGSCVEPQGGRVFGCSAHSSQTLCRNSTMKVSFPERYNYMLGNKLDSSIASKAKG